MESEGSHPTSAEYSPRKVLSVLKLLAFRVEYPVVFFLLSYQLYNLLIEQYYYKSYGLKELQDVSFNKTAGEAFCLTEELLTNLSGDNETFKLVQSESNHLVAYGQLVRNIFAITVTTFMLGPLTNRIGRKIGIILPAIGGLVQGALTIIIVKYNLNPYYFILTNVVAGISGDFASLLSSSYAYTADVSIVKYRSLRFGLIEGSIALGSAIGQLCGGFFLESVHCNYIPPILLYMASNIFVLVYVIFILPESTSSEERKKDFTTGTQHFIKYIKGFKMYFGGLSRRKTWHIYIATITANVAAFTIVGAAILSVFFLKTQPFDLSPFKIGIYQSIRSVSQGLSNLIIPGIFTFLIKNPDPWLILTAFLCAGTGDLLLGFSNNSWQIYILAILQGIEGIAWAGSRGLASKLNRAEEQIALFAIMASLESLSSMAGASLWPVIFASTLQDNMRSGTTYFIMASVELLMVPLASSLLFIRIRTSSENISQEKSNDEETEDLIIDIHDKML